MDRILGLREQHGLELPGEFFFRYVQVLERMEQYDEAIQVAARYLASAGRDGAHYREALQLLNSAEAAKTAAEAAAEAIRRRVEAARKRVETAVAGMEFVRVPAGEFHVGSTSRQADRDERPVTRCGSAGRSSWANTRWRSGSGGR